MRSKPCKTHDMCRGAGYPEHIKRWYGSRSVDNILFQLSYHCGNEWSGGLSCPCSQAAKELKRRGIIVLGFRNEESKGW